MTEAEAKRILEHCLQYGSNGFTKRQMTLAWIALSKGSVKESRQIEHGQKRQQIGPNACRY